ncbi:hypothetical protein GCM10010992_05700 [Cloacibacterium rupense]|uniref:Uncharacterized protein n=1 Tax=Cloacibacterium rupense TaxID=517423 RepID=A0ABQ2NFQ2_9FLAO|nr:hypothetical protein GCM10010992_05700 [Cloacibacterium rupense]
MMRCWLRGSRFEVRDTGFLMQGDEVEVKVKVKVKVKVEVKVEVEVESDEVSDE